MKHFAYICIGVLALAVSFHLGAQVTQAGTGQIIALGDLGEYARVVLDSGEIASWHPTAGWQNVIPNQLPFPPAELAFHSWRYLVDTSNNLWWINFSSQWELIGPPPAITGIPESPHLQPSTWGEVKTRAR